MIPISRLPTFGKEWNVLKESGKKTLKTDGEGGMMHYRVREVMLGIRPGTDGVVGGGGSTCCGRILHNRKWTGRMFRLYQEIGTWRMEPVNIAQSS